MEIIDALNGHSDHALRDKFSCALSCVQRAFDLFGFAGLAFSFNGGKDSTVLLHILRAAVAERRLQAANDFHSQGTVQNGTQEGDLGRVCTFIFERKDDFPEILDFVKAADRKHGLRVEELVGSFQSGLVGLLARKPIKAVVIGTRRGDPNAGGQDMCCLSTPGWPAFMRVNPILEWSYSDVWAFLRVTKVDYCSLYDQGYSSLGSTADTSPNGALKKEDGSFAPAYMLADNRLERAGRVKPGTPRVRNPSAFTKTASLVIIGDEILSGKVPDENAGFLARELFALGWRLCQIVTIADEVAEIGKVVQAASENYDIVITTGGVGPTLDDVTMAGVAQGLGYSLTTNECLESRLRAYFGDHVTDAHLKMAAAPAEEVHLLEVTKADGSTSPFPVVCCRNIFILPGVPHLLHQKWKAVKERLKKEQALPGFHSIALRLSLKDETVIASKLNSLDDQMGSRVGVKSYPVTQQVDGTGIVVLLESKDEKSLSQAEELLSTQLPSGCIVSMEHNPSSLSKQIAPTTE